MLDNDRIRQLRHTGHIRHEADRVRLRLFDLLPHSRQSCILLRSKSCPLLYILLRVILTVDCPTDELVTIKCGGLRLDCKILLIGICLLIAVGIVSTSRDALCAAQTAFIMHLIAKRQTLNCYL